MDALDIKSNRLEIMMFSAYVNWFEIGSHAGKPVPFVSYFPPLAPIYKAIFGNVDARNVEFHERHHNKIKQNYGITQWCDILFGTHKIQPQSEISREEQPEDEQNSDTLLE